MTKHKQQIRTIQTDNKASTDRATIIVTAHYQEYDPPNTTYVRHAFDYVKSPENVPIQRNVRIDISAKLAIDISPLEHGSAEYVLSHSKTKLTEVENKEFMQKLQEAQENNIISVFDASGNKIADIGVNRVLVGRFAGPLFAQSSLSSAILNVTAFPA